MSYCHVTAQLDEYLSAQDALAAEDAALERLIREIEKEYGERIEELASALNTDEGEILSRLADYRLALEKRAAQERADEARIDAFCASQGR
jgi:hypothetical protein